MNIFQSIKKYFYSTSDNNITITVSRDAYGELKDRIKSDLNAVKWLYDFMAEKASERDEIYSGSVNRRFELLSEINAELIRAEGEM